MRRIKLNQKINQVQKNVLSPGSKLFIKIINLNLNEINEIVEKELIENPCVEEETIGNSIDNQGLDSSGIRLYEIGKGEFNENMLEDKSASLVDYLSRQLNLLEIDGYDKKLLYSLIHLLDEDGFLKYTNNEIVEIIKEEVGINIGGIQIEELILKGQRNFDPSGVFTRSVKESLILQLELSNNKNLSIYSNIINNHFQNLANKKFDIIAKDMNIDTDLIKDCLDTIAELEPKPARAFIKINNGRLYNEPEAYIYENNNKLVFQLNKNFRKIRTSSYYEDMIIHKKEIDTEVINYIKSKINNGKILIKTILEREEIYKKVLKTIIDIQHDYIIKGERFLKPLKLADIASIVGCHESTISRITSNKFVSTPRGMINMKTFFSNKVDSKDDTSSVAVKDIINEIINMENKTIPFSDEEVKGILCKKGINIARRTIAKYRNILKIPSSFKRSKK